jgi:hypothetical protein
MKICPMEAMMFYAERQTDMTNLIVAFNRFANAPKNLILPGGEPRLPGCLATNVPDKVFNVIKG